MIKLKRPRSRSERPPLLPPVKGAVKQRRPFTLSFNTYLFMCLAGLTACILLTLLIGTDIKLVYDDGQLNYIFRGSVLITPHGDGLKTNSRSSVAEARKAQAVQQQGRAASQLDAAAINQQQKSSADSTGSVQPAAPVEGVLTVALVNRHWWPSLWGDEWTDNCHDTVQPYSCHYVNLFSETSKFTEIGRAQMASQADALLYNVCPDTPPPEGSRPNISVIVNSAESSANYPCLDDAGVMSKVSFEMSYRSCAQVCGPTGAAPCLMAGSISGNMPVAAGSAVSS